MVHDWFVHKRSRRPSSSRSRSPPATTGRDPTMHVPRTEPGSGARRIDTAAGLRQPEQPLVGRVADLRLGRRRPRRSCGRRRRQAEDRADRAAAGRSGHRRAPQRIHRQLVDRPRDAPHAVHAASTTTSATCSRTSTPTGTTSSCSTRPGSSTAALMAKIHTVEWTPAILPHPIIQPAMHANW